MEQSLSSFAFKGSVIEAIRESKHQKKLFVVYISGENPESRHLETSTWMDARVADTLSKYCVMLHIFEGSSDAANFSAIYPQKPAPCITAIGYNGIQLWQNEGPVTAEVLASTLEKTWLSLHVQETTATLLTAALASKNQLGPGAFDPISSEQGSTSNVNVLSSPVDKHEESPEDRKVADSVTVEENKVNEYADETTNSKIVGVASPVSAANERVEAVLDTKQATRSGVANESLDPLKLDANGIDNGSAVLEENADSYESHVPPDTDVNQQVATDTSKAKEIDNIENMEAENAQSSDLYASKSNDVHLNIRLPDGSSLQVKFSVTDTLRMVKNYVDEKKTSNFGSYNLAIPYPRKVFNDEDLDRTLSELDLFNRQALIVVLHNRTDSYDRGKVSSLSQSDLTNPSSGSNGGYWALMRRMLSYVNPFSYLSGGASSSNTEEESQSSMWQYNPNPSLQNDLRGTTTGYSSNQIGPATSTRANNNSRQRTPSRFGSNIHTLKHDEDDAQFNDRNAFWNGNSTEYGGNNDGR